MLIDAIHEAMYDRLRLKWLHALDLTLHSYQPEVDPATGRLIYAWEDEPHKLKNLLHGILNQLMPTATELDQLLQSIQQALQGDQEDWKLLAAVHTELLLPRGPLLAVALCRPEFRTIATILQGSTDKQNVPCAEALFTNESYIAAVNAAGYPTAATVMLVFGRAYLAADVRGLHLTVRCTWMHERSLLASQVPLAPLVDNATMGWQRIHVC